MALRTDLASEKQGLQFSKEDKDIVRSEVVDADHNRYVTYESNIIKQGETEKYSKLTRCISKTLLEFKGKKKNVLVVGLGNPNLTADSLGNATVKRLVITRHIATHVKRIPSVSAIIPSVLGVTGIESFDVIKGVTERVKPDLVIAVDSLASATVGRIASVFQLCDGGITPGSGVSNHRQRLSKETLGVEVISIGVPLVVYATTIIEEASGKNEEYTEEISSLIVTPKEIDILVEECGKIISSAINFAYLGEENFSGIF